MDLKYDSLYKNLTGLDAKIYSLGMEKINPEYILWLENQLESCLRAVTNFIVDSSKKYNSPKPENTETPAPFVLDIKKIKEEIGPIEKDLSLNGVGEKIDKMAKDMLELKLDFIERYGVDAARYFLKMAQILPGFMLEKQLPIKTK